MSITSDQDWRGLRDVGRIVALTLDALERAVAPGRSTQELDDIARERLSAHGARSAPALFYGFPGHVLVSVNDEVVHGVPGPRVLQPGDLVKLDVTLEKGGYVADAARSVIVGEATGTALRLKHCAESAFQRAMDVIRPGALVREIGAAIDGCVTARGFSVVRELGGHGLGRRIHEWPSVPNYCDRRQRDRLHDGLVIAVEPIISAGRGAALVGSDGWTIRTQDGSLAAHFEHTVAVTAAGPVLLTTP